MNISRMLALGGSICRFYEGLRLWEARFVVFYEGLRLWGAQCLTKLWKKVGPLKKNLHVRGGRGSGWEA